MFLLLSTETFYADVINLFHVLVEWCVYCSFNEGFRIFDHLPKSWEYHFYQHIYVCHQKFIRYLDSDITYISDYFLTTLPKLENVIGEIYLILVCPHVLF